MTIPAKQQILIVGPSGSGKTSMLSLLQWASEKSLRDHAKYPCEVIPTNEATKNLFHQGKQTADKGELPFKASEKTTEYTFDVEVDLSKNARWWDKMIGPSKPSSSFCFLDAPGGAGLPNPADIQAGTYDEVQMSEFRQSLIARASVSQGLMLCIDAADDNSADVYFSGLSDLFVDIIHSLKTRHLPFQQIMVVLTKVERFLQDYGRRAEEKAKEDPVPRAAELLTEAGLGAITTYTLPRHRKVACVFTSCYGFTDLGSPNYIKDEKREGLRAYHEQGHKIEIRKIWRPFQLLEPFIYLTAGVSDAIRLAHL